MPKQAKLKASKRKSRKNRIKSAGAEALRFFAYFTLKYNEMKI